MLRAEQVTDAVAYHGEGPCWSPTWGGLRWVDMLAGDLLTLDEDGSVSRLHVGDLAAFVRPRSRGGYVVGLERGIGLAESPDGLPTPQPELWSDPGVRMNEAGCDPWGVLYAGSMAYDARPGGARLYRITPAGDVTVVIDDATISNGLDFSPDGTLAYYDDTATGRTDVFDVVDRRLTNRRPFFAREDESPDGLTVDSAGNVWVALNGAGRVRCVSPSGEVLAEVEVPVRLTTACTLGGPDLRDLYISTSREHLEDPEPEAGALFRVRVEVPGRPVLPFGG
ncbi:SMP-30/gluconolactonase/LRE family protein [Cellulomonas xiejunii]|uniref:SMP-30/gluconolactonase/LRE family protein n=1 Tax=Cellulomonas xiejunii TaxID=2968083 RepID=A0ABY5KPN2_9CELL|nr:SMP-30/gluconolactonase/LRE family protein [Cellulomonas xiejunii]MCC2321131.1 SMP-30/gluconolactonase/LRE family protein [Cellulomonas xiejunii]UUI71724.1 SMP-30/gluconolactonase/LRE family protein [Cellulomonas xiejunii]